MTKKKLKVAVIGTGNMGKNHVRVFGELKNCNLVAICDINFQTMEKISKEFNCKGYLNYKEMLAKEKIDAVSIAVPTKLHKEVAVYCLKNNICTLVEKPIACTLKEAQEIISTENKARAKLTVGHIERFNPAIIKLRQIIRRGELGQIISINTKRLGPHIPKKRDTGVILDLAVHDIDIINNLFNRNPVKVYANAGSFILKDKEDCAEIFLDYGKASGHIQVNWISPVKIRELELTGTKGYAKVDYIAQEIQIYKSIFSKERDGYMQVLSQPKIFKLKYKEPLKEELNSFILSIIKGKNFLVSPFDAKDTLGIALEALKKSKYGDIKR